MGSRRSRDRHTSENKDKGKGKGRMESPSRCETEDGEEKVSSTGPNYTHDRWTGAAADEAAAAAAGIPTRTTEAGHVDTEPRARRSPASGGGGGGKGGGAGDPNHDLVGIGSSLDKQSEFRQPACSDEDLGLGSNLTQDVTSMA